MNQSSRSIPILMYHAVGHPVSCKRDTFLNVSAESFRRQMRALAALGYRGQTFASVVEAFGAGKSLPRRTFAITFDDAYDCVREAAAPLLIQHAFPATLFVVPAWTNKSERVGSENGRMNLPVMNWDALQSLLSHGWEAAGHTRSHPHLDAMCDAEASEEILQGKRETEARLNTTLHTFCYPFGHYNARTPSLVREAGFAGACTVRSGLATGASDLYALPRIKISYRDGVFGLLYRLLVRPSLPTFRRNRRSHAAAAVR